VSEEGTAWITVRVKKELRKKLKHLAVENDTPMQNVIDEALREYVKKRERQQRE